MQGSSQEQEQALCLNTGRDPGKLLEGGLDESGPSISGCHNHIGCRFSDNAASQISARSDYRLDSVLDMLQCLRF